MLDAKTQEVITHSCKMSNMHLSLQKLLLIARNVRKNIINI
jgi:hypothetical protein